MGKGPVSMQVTVNPYSTTTGYGTPTHCDTDTEYASVVYSSSPTMARRNLMNPGTRFNSQYSSLSPRPVGHQTTYLSPQLARLNSTLRPSAHTLNSANGSPVHRQSAMSSTTTLSTCLSPRSGRYPLSEAEMPNLSYDPNVQNHVYCEIPVSQHQNKQPGHRMLQNQLRNKLRQQQQHDETEFYEDTTQCDLHNISDLSDDEQWSFSTKVQQQHSSCSSSPKHFPNSSRTASQRQLIGGPPNNGSPSHNNKKPKRFQHSQHLSPPPLKQSTKDQMSQLPATDV